MTLTANADVARPIDQDIRQYPVAASVHIFKGSWVGLDPAGLAKPFVPGDVLIGLAYEESDNSTGAASAKKIRVWVQTDVSFALTGLADKHAGRAVYATADDAIALGRSPGRIRWPRAAQRPGQRGSDHPAQDTW